MTISTNRGLRTGSWWWTWGIQISFRGGISHRSLPCEAKRQYLLTCKVNRCCFLAWHRWSHKIKSHSLSSGPSVKRVGAAKWAKKRIRSFRALHAGVPSWYFITRTSVKYCFLTDRLLLNTTMVLLVLCYWQVKSLLYQWERTKLDRFVDPNVWGAQRRVYSDLQIYCNWAIPSTQKAPAWPQDLFND